MGKDGVSLRPELSRMAWTAEQKRAARAADAAARAADEAVQGVKRRPTGRAPALKSWDEHTGVWVADAVTIVPVVTPRVAIVDTHDVASRAACCAWAVANPPPRRDDFDSHRLWDIDREPWYAQFMGKRLPPYTHNNAERSGAWRRALQRHAQAVWTHQHSDGRVKRPPLQVELEAAENEAAQREAAQRKAQCVQAERQAKEAQELEKLADCERRHMVAYHEVCGHWHHPKVPCEDAHKWPMREVPETFVENYAGAIYVEAMGTVHGKRTEEECKKSWGRCTGSIRNGRLIAPWAELLACPNKACRFHQPPNPRVHPSYTPHWD